MKKASFIGSLVAIALSTVIMSNSIFAQETVADKAENVVEKVGSSIDSSMQKIDHFMDDSSITAKVKSALLDEKSIQDADISVKTNDGIVTLSGFVASHEQLTQATKVAKQIEGVKSVSNKLQVQEGKHHSVENYVSDSVITSEIKAKFLADKDIPSSKIEVKTSNGTVQLTGTVDKAEQSALAESIVKHVTGVKNVKNDLMVKQTP